MRPNIDNIRTSANQIYLTLRDLKEVNDYIFQFNILNLISSFTGHPLRNKSLDKKFRKELIKEVWKTIEWDQKNIRKGIYSADVKNYKTLKDKTFGFLNILSDYPKVVLNRKNNRTTLNEFSEQFPSYFTRNFHFQSDGYLSERSAKLYDQQVDILFTGLANTMRRCFLPFAKEYFEKTFRPLDILEMAAGTGSGAEQLIHIFPKANYTLNDLSPYYLNQAKHKFKEKPFQYVEGEAHQLSQLKDESFDLTFHIYLFHEIPEDLRFEVIREQIRLTKKNGLVIICDSLQSSDRPEWKEVLEDFPRKYHEPFYRNYINHDLNKMLEDQGLEIVHQEKVLLTKCIIARKK